MLLCEGAGFLNDVCHECIKMQQPLISAKNAAITGVLE